MTNHLNYFVSARVIAACALFIIISGCNKTQDTDIVSSAPTIGTEIDDSVITTKVKAALMSNDDVKSFDIKVMTYKGDVVLSGFTHNQMQIENSIAVAKSVDGVKNVTNKLTLKEGEQTVGNEIDDSVITAKVKSALLADSMMKSLDVSVITRKGQVQLSGFVDNTAQLTRAVDVVKSVENVKSVTNHMTIKQ